MNQKIAKTGAIIVILAAPCMHVVTNRIHYEIYKRERISGRGTRKREFYGWNIGCFML